MKKEHGGIQGVTYPIIADTNKTISKNYDVLAGDFYYDEDGYMQADGELIAYRGLFLIDKQGIVRHQLINDLPLGRNVDEVLRMVDALQFTEENGEACPADWNSKKEGLKTTHEGVANYLSQHQN
jgi:peroxiredoxin (alkyl hydroperoxide reductase subunit C)